ncbi:MAG: flavodoxin family protein [Deltaproteobacteria bacterium]|nr:flavodoxin family protein [Deltaproteobacteria bacterium]
MARKKIDMGKGAVKVLVLRGSPRKKGNSGHLADAAAAGAREAGAEVEDVLLHALDIGPCAACGHCHRAKHAGRCRIDDDMQGLYPKLRAADALILASPIYWFTVSAQTKLLMDRCYALMGDKDPEGRSPLAGKRVGILLTYAEPDPLFSGVANAVRTFQDMFGYIGAPIVDIVHAAAEEAGDIATNPEALRRARELGRALAKSPVPPPAAA